MAPPKAAAKKVKASTAQSGKKEKLFHPQSRKADQLMRVQLRKQKLADLTKNRKLKHGEKVDLYSFFYAAIPTEGVLTLEDVHTIIREVWLPRYDGELEAEVASRRKGRPKSAKEHKIEELKLREAEDYRTGMEVIDLTHPANVELFRAWDQKEAAYIEQLRFIRISSSKPDAFSVARQGKHPSLVTPTTTVHTSPSAGHLADVSMDADDEDKVPLLLEPPQRFASTMMAMDG